MDFFAGSDVGLLPSYFPGESVPLVVIENMFCEKPLIATDIGEINEMITDEIGSKSGILLELKNNRVNVLDLAQAMVKISSDKDLYKQYCKVASKTKHKFDIEPISDQYIEVYKKIIKFSN
jgi:glycosyltransferase involved in cell wall biosynthesis